MSNEFELRDFEKEKIVALIGKMRAWLESQGIESTIWSIEPWTFTLQIQTQRANLSELLFKLYEYPEVLTVSFTIEPVTKSLLTHVGLNERWFSEEKHAEKIKHRKHPEAEGGTLS